MVGKNWFAGALLVATTLAPSTVRAQTKEDLMLPVPASDVAIGGRFGRALPGVSASSPVAFGANFRDVFAFVGYQAKTRFADSDDGTASVGFGLGNSSDAIGLEVVFTTLSTVRSGLFDRTAAGFKVHRLLPGMVSIAAGIDVVTPAGPRTAARAGERRADCCTARRRRAATDQRMQETGIAIESSSAPQQ